MLRSGNSKKKIVKLATMFAVILVAISVMLGLMQPGIALTGNFTTSDSTADVETEETWKQSFADVQLTDDFNSNLVSIANTQIGYKESELNYYTVTETDEHKGYTRYGAFVNDNYMNWDTSFVDFCMNYAGYPQDVLSLYSNNIDTWIQSLQDNELYVDNTNTEYQLGDLVFFQKVNQETSKQVGIITEINVREDGTYISVIEGNCDNEVKKNEYSINDTNIIGYSLIHKIQQSLQETNQIEETSIDTPITEEETYSDESDISVVDVQSDEKIDDAVTLNVTSSTSEGKNGQTLYINVNSTNSHPNDTETGEILKVNIGTLPEGVTIDGFTDGKMVVSYGSGTTTGTIEVTLHQNEDGTSYVTYTQPAGSTISFVLQFNSKNGTMDETNTVTVTPEIVNAQDNDKVTVDGKTDVTSKTLTWTGESKWDNLSKSVDKTQLDINTETNTLVGKLTYTIQAQEFNKDGDNDTGSIWTKEVLLTDTLSLPSGMTFPQGSKVQDNKVVDKDGNVIFEFDFSSITNTNKASVDVEEITLSSDLKSIVYKIKVTNINKNSDGSYKGEMDSISNLKATLDASKLTLSDEYKTKTNDDLKAEKISNKIEIETAAVKGNYSYKDNKTVETNPQKTENYDVKKESTQGGKVVYEVQPGSTIQYTITVTNSGSTVLSAKDADGNNYTITDQLPSQLTLTDSQIAKIQQLGGTVELQADNTYKVTFPQTNDIGVGKKWEITFDATVKDEKTLTQEGNGFSICNKASYREKDGESRVNVNKTDINLTKVADKDTVKNGDIVTYTITIENPNDFATTFDEILTDTLSQYLELQGMYDTNGNQITVGADGSYYIGNHKIVLTQNNNQDGSTTLKWNVGTLGAHEKVIITYKCKLNVSNASGVTSIKNTVNTNHGDHDETDTKVTPPTTVDKKVKSTDESDYSDGNKSYENGTVLDYKISIQNASGEEASTKQNHILTDSLKAGLLLNVDKLYTLSNKSESDYLNGLITMEDLQESSQTLQTYLSKNPDSGDWGPYYAIINNDIVQIKKLNNEYSTSTTFGTQLNWYIGYLEPGQLVEKNYQVILSMADSESAGTSYMNTVTDGGSSKSVTVKGGEDEKQPYQADIRKDVYAITNTTNNDALTQYPNKTYFSLNDSGDKYVIYNITVINSGTESINVKKVVDSYGEHLSYIGMARKIYNFNLYQFKNDPITVNDYNVRHDISYNDDDLPENLGNITFESNNESTHEVTYSVGGENGIDLPAKKAFSFFVLCKVNDNVTENELLTNTAKLYVDKDVQYGSYGEIKTQKTKDDAYQNNGDSQDEGIIDDQRVISSSVTVIPQNKIVPGITKEAKGYVLSGKDISQIQAITSENKKKNIMPNSTVKWELNLYNDGTIPIEEYTIEDSVESPFHIMTEGEAKKIGITSDNKVANKVFLLEIYDSKSSTQSIETYDLSSEIWNQIQDGTDNNYSTSFSVDITSAMRGTNNKSLQIPAGGYAKLTVYTNCVQQTFTIYENTATFLPKDSFNGTDVVTGQVVEDEQGNIIGVKASDSVYAMGEYGSFSWKTIAEESDITNNAVGYDTSKNYITIDNEDTNKKVIYTNNIENVSEHEYEKMTIVDLMPFVGDTGVLNQSQKRDSEFTVGYNGNLLLTVKNQSDSSKDRTLVQGTDYTIQFSSKTSFTESDLGNGDADDWHDEWQANDKSFRIVMNSEFKLQPTEILSIQYEGLIGSDAQPGQIAWNSFGYAYDVTGASRLRAEPPKVGVKIRQSPTITKKVVDNDGNDKGYDESKLFTFNVYEGESIDETKLKGTFTVKQGESKKFNTIVDGNGIKIFQSGTTYTIMEVVDNTYTFQSVKGSGDEEASTENKYTFTYFESLDSINITFTNKLNEYVLPSTGGSGTTRYVIGGAVLMLLATFLYTYKNRHKPERRTLP